MGILDSHIETERKNGRIILFEATRFAVIGLSEHVSAFACRVIANNLNTDLTCMKPEAIRLNMEAPRNPTEPNDKIKSFALMIKYCIDKDQLEKAGQHIVLEPLSLTPKKSRLKCAFTAFVDNERILSPEEVESTFKTEGYK